jgi:heat shock protein HtpX
MADSTFYDQINANRRNAFLLAFLVVLLLGALGFSVGYALTGDLTGAIGTTALAVVLGLVMSLGSYYAGDQLVLAASSAKPVDETSAAADERRP